MGLKQPVECSSQGVYADWEASLKASTVSLRVFQRALEEVGVQLSRARVREVRAWVIGGAANRNDLTGIFLPERDPLISTIVCPCSPFFTYPTSACGSLPNEGYFPFSSAVSPAVPVVNLHFLVCSEPKRVMCLNQDFHL